MIQQNLEERRKKKLQISGVGTETRNDEAFKTSTMETGESLHALVNKSISLGSRH